jgi:Transglycosylase SLT domain
MENISLESVDPTKRRTAQKIVNAFDRAGFGTLQQVTAVASAIIESNLNPSATSQDGVGLFQLNTRGGFGTGNTTEQLQDPDINIDIMVTAAKKISEFVNATSLDDAASAFGRRIHRPQDLDSYIARLRKEALRLLTSESRSPAS